MLKFTIIRAFKVFKLEKNAYKEIAKDSSSFFQSVIIIFAAALLNIYLFNKYVNPQLPTQIPLIPVFLTWILFNWYLFSKILNFVSIRFSEIKLKNNPNVALSLVGFSYTAEILKILIILSPNFIRVISWGALMLVLASQVIGVKEIYRIQKIWTSIGIVAISYIIQISILIILVLFFAKIGS